MKKLLIFIISVGLILAINLNAAAAIHNLDGDFNHWLQLSTGLMIEHFGQMGTDAWYEVEEKRPSVRAMAIVPDGDGFIAGADYTVNDQTFLSLLYMDGSESIDLRGSYLFESGLFVGIEYIEDDEATILSPGYRFNISDDTYLALSIDYYVDESEVLAYDLDFKHLFDGGRFYAQYYSATEDFYDEDYIDLGVRYAVSDAVVVGLDRFFMDSDSDEAFFAGLTWNSDMWVVDFQLGEMADSTLTRLSGLFKINDAIGLGAEYYKPEDEDEEYIVKFKYTTDSNTFNLGYAIEGEVFLINCKWYL